MVKHLRNIITVSLLMICHNAFSGSGSFFNVSATGTAAAVQMSLCLNGKGKTSSCQTHSVSALTLNILTTIPNHTYTHAGIKINTPGYALSNCSLQKNGYCLFSVSNTKTATIVLTPQTCQANVISFSPTATSVNNPGGSTPSTAQKFEIKMTMCNSQGQPLIPSKNNPIHVDVYGAPKGVIQPTSTTTSTGSVTFTYNGKAFPNNISINAWISDSSNNGAALGVTQVLQQNTPPCSYRNTSYQVPLVQTLPYPLQVMADVGYNTSSSTATLNKFTIDTGSLGVIVPIHELPISNVIGPGAPGVKYYDSSGNTYSGNYYLAPVRVQTSNGIVQTIPIIVLGIDKAYCSGPTTRSCYSNPPTPDLHYMGVGFNRNSTATNDLFNSPTANAFLHLTNAENGTNLSPGYYLTPNDTTTATGLTLGITNSNGYNVVNLSPNPAVPGDFNAQAGCFSFPNSPQTNQFCGTALLDVGIDSMFIDLPKAQWPAGTYNSKDEVPAGISMSILMGSLSTPAMQYSFNTVNGTLPPMDSPTPTLVQWIDSTATGQVFVNTGRRPLYFYDYFYNGQCGQVGFKPLQ
ncbi:MULTISPECIES: hypothetical protein [Legionella]|uniref:hypothetical protein n=1 Tax=Legionella TaxID=445 RepID=UPI000964708C|nr:MULTISPECIES: hypothetical protein [Legionella]MBN9226303.1 hypothetical protein [Legionella steelei]OJW12046.1 MAG: hypothetical protein BGO44_03165 [Legionella sp. 39-23]